MKNGKTLDLSRGNLSGACAPEFSAAPRRGKQGGRSTAAEEKQGTPSGSEDNCETHTRGGGRGSNRKGAAKGAHGEQRETHKSSKAGGGEGGKSRKKKKKGEGGGKRKRRAGKKHQTKQVTRKNTKKNIGGGGHTAPRPRAPGARNQRKPETRGCREREEKGKFKERQTKGEAKGNPSTEGAEQGRRTKRPQDR